jgi:hypothetical protein
VIVLSCFCSFLLGLSGKSTRPREGPGTVFGPGLPKVMHGWSVEATGQQGCLGEVTCAGSWETW